MSCVCHATLCAPLRSPPYRVSRVQCPHHTGWKQERPTHAKVGVCFSCLRMLGGVGASRVTAQQGGDSGDGPKAGERLSRAISGVLGKAE